MLINHFSYHWEIPKNIIISGILILRIRNSRNLNSNEIFLCVGYYQSLGGRQQRYWMCRYCVYQGRYTFHQQHPQYLHRFVLQVVFPPQTNHPISARTSRKRKDIVWSTNMHQQGYRVLEHINIIYHHPIGVVFSIVRSA